MLDRRALDDSQSARTASKNESTRQSRVVREPAWRTAQKHSCSLSRLSRASPSHATARYAGPGGGGAQAANQSPVVARKHRLPPSPCRESVVVHGQARAQKACVFSGRAF